MRRHLAAFFVQILLIFLLSFSSLNAQIPLLLTPAIPSPTDVIRLLDTLTRKDSSNNIVAKANKTMPQSKLLIARTRVAVTLTRSSRNWRGRVEVELTVPTEVTYSIDLSTIKSEHIRCDKQKRKLIVQMPTPLVEDVTPVLSEVKSNDDYRRARFKLLDASVAQQIQYSLLRVDFQTRARQSAETETPRIRQEGRVVLEKLLQQLLQPSFPDFTVEVE